MKKDTIGVALLGCGNVGSGTFRVLEENAGLIARRVGAEVKVKTILVKDLGKDRGPEIPRQLLTDDYASILNDPDIDIVAELMGGLDPAISYMQQALLAGKHVVSANKAALARSGEALTRTALEQRLMLRYEAAVCGAIPVMNAISTALAANEITQIQGILNGTTNYILTRMDEDHAPYAQVLKDAQDKGFAEADPTGDVEGHDAVNKLTLLIAAGFGEYVSPDDIEREGITGVTEEDLRNAAEQNRKIKLIATAVKEKDGIRAWVRPESVPAENPLSRVRNEFNAVLISCNMADDIFLQGRGAGPLPTGSAVAGDITEIAACIARGTEMNALPTWRL